MRKAQGVFNKPVHASGYDSIPGQVPGKSLPLSARPRLSPDVERLLTTMPPGVSLDRMTDRPVLRAQDAVSNLGLTKAMESTLALSIQKEAMTATNQLTFQKAINATMMETGLPPDLQSVINSRAKRFFATTLQKSGRRETYSLTDLAELKKSASRPAAPLKPSMSLKKDPGDAKAEKEAEDAANKDAGVQKAAYVIERNAANPEKLKKRGEAARAKKLLEKGEGEGSRGGKVIGHTASGEAIYASEAKGKDLKARNAQKKRLQMGHMDTIANSKHEHPHVKRAQKEIPHIHESLKQGKGVSEAHKEVVMQAFEAMRDHPLKKAKFEETGGKFVAKVKKDGKTRYFYDEEEYKKTHGEHVTGEEARKRHIHKKVHETTHAAGEHGVDVTAYKDLVQKFGPKPVHDAVKSHVEGGVLKFKKGRFFSNKEPEGKKPEIKKSIFTIQER